MNCRKIYFEGPKIASAIMLCIALVAACGQHKSPSEVQEAGPSPSRPELIVQTGHSSVVHSLVFSPDGKMLASGSWDHTIKLWDVVSGAELRTLKGHSDRVTSVAFSPDGKMLASGSWDHTIKLWDVVSGAELRTLKGHSDGVQRLFRSTSSAAIKPPKSLIPTARGE